MISRCPLLAGTGVTILAAPSLASDRGRGPVLPPVALLTGSAGSHSAFLGALRGQGYTEGQTIQIEARVH